MQYIKTFMDTSKLCYRYYQIPVKESDEIKPVHIPDTILLIIFVIAVIAFLWIWWKIK
jgi:hypothetical protein